MAPAGHADRFRSGRAGFTLVEFVVTLAIIAIVSMTALPSFDNFRAGQRVSGVADNLYTDLQYARSEAIQRNAPVAVSFSTGASWCYGIHQLDEASDPPCNCTVASGSGACNIKRVSSAEVSGLQIASANFGGDDAYVVEPRRGTSVDAGNAPVEGAVVVGDGVRSVRADVNAMGRVRLCSPSGSLPRYPAC